MAVVARIGQGENSLGGGFIPSGSEQVNLVLRGQAQLTKSRTKLEDSGLILLVGQEAVARELKKLPLLVDFPNLAVHILLDLLCLPVKLDKLAIAKGLVVGIDASTAAYNVEDVVDIVGGTGEEAVLGSRMSPRNCFARDFWVVRSIDGIRWLMHRVQGHDARGVVGHDAVGARGGTRIERIGWGERSQELVEGRWRTQQETAGGGHTVK